MVKQKSNFGSTSYTPSLDNQNMKIYDFVFLQNSVRQCYPSTPSNFLVKIIRCGSVKILTGHRVWVDISGIIYQLSGIFQVRLDFSKTEIIPFSSS